MISETATTPVIRSISVFGCVAAKTPSGTPISTASIRLATREDDRVRQRAEHERRDLLVAREVDAEVPLQRARDEVPDLMGHRQVELHLVPDGLRQLRIRARAEDRRHRIPGDEVHERRHEHHDDQNDQRRHRESLEEVGQQNKLPGG